MLGVLMLTYSVEAWKLLVTNFALQSNISFWEAMFLRYMINHIILKFCGEIGKLGTKQCNSTTTLFMTSQIMLCIFLNTIVTSNSFTSIEKRHFKIRSLTELSEISVKVELT